MDEEERVAELHLEVVTVVLGELVLVEAVEGTLKAVLYLARELAEFLAGVGGRIAPLIAHQQLHDLIGTQHRLLHGTGHEVVTIMHFRQLHEQKHGDAAEMHLGACIDGETGDEFRRHLAHQGGDAVDTLVLLLVAQVAQRCCHHGGVQLQLRSHGVGLGSLVIRHGHLFFQF